MTTRTVYASTVATLDSNVHSGGGSDVTGELQEVLDMAQDGYGVRLIMDGAALVTHLKVHSNTRIECLNKDCGFYQKDGADDSIITNYHWANNRISTRNITLVGGTYNQNCAHQCHDRPLRDDEKGGPFEKWTFGLEFYGVEHLTIRDCIVRDFRTFAVTVGSFRNVTIENVWLDLPGRMQAWNQDGFHFWGPGQFLTVRNVGGKVGDDFMNIGPDEQDKVSSITDVLVDGVFLDDADQGVRLLSRGTGQLDRVTIRNVVGTYRSFGFYINAWFPDVTCGEFGNILFENINLKHTAPNYTFRPPILFSIGGKIRSLTFKNVHHSDPIDARALFEIGLPFYATPPEAIDDYEFAEGCNPVVDLFLLDGLTILENSDRSRGAEYIQVFGKIRHMIVKNVVALKDSGLSRSGHLIVLRKRADVDTALFRDIHAVGYEDLITGKEKVRKLIVKDVEEA